MKNKLVISLLSILVLVLGVFAYVLSSKTLESTKSFERDITKVESTSDSDEVDSIEADINATDLDSIDKELTDIQTEIQ